jgi:hypothetical protein
MRPNYEDAVLRRADMASLQVWTQTAIRIVLAIALLWALISTALVWYWMGYYGGPPAHEYFGRWVLAWFFTEIIPLPFGSIPYKGERYTIDSMYRYLSWKYYFGGSFAGWFWHYAPWGALLTGLVVGGVLLIMFAPPRRPRGARYIRGTDVIPSQRLAREIARDGILVGDMRTPRRHERQHFLISGAPGTGKSTAIRSILRQVAQRGEIAVVLDPECEYVPEFYRPERGDLILNPLDVRCPSWSPWSELMPGSEAMDAEALAAALIPDPPNTFSQGGADFFFRQSARTLLVGLLAALKSRDPADIPRLLALSRHQLKEALRGTPAEALIDPGAHEQGAGIVATAFNATSSFRHLPGRAEWSWSALEWADTRHGWLFLSSTEESREAALPLQSLWLDCVVRRLMAAEEPLSQVWIIADELPQAELRERPQTWPLCGARLSGDHAASRDLRSRPNGDPRCGSGNQAHSPHRRRRDRAMVERANRRARSHAPRGGAEHKRAERVYDSPTSAGRERGTGKRDPDATAVRRLPLHSRSSSRAGPHPVPRSSQTPARIHQTDRGGYR